MSEALAGACADRGEDLGPVHFEHQDDDDEDEHGVDEDAPG